jgi:hypothetical protein
MTSCQMSHTWLAHWILTFHFLCSYWCLQNFVLRLVSLCQLHWAFSSSALILIAIYMWSVTALSCLHFKFKVSKHSCIWDFFPCHRTSKFSFLIFKKKTFSSRVFCKTSVIIITNFLDSPTRTLGAALDSLCLTAHIWTITDSVGATLRYV